MQNNLLPVPMLPLTICPHPFLMERISRLAVLGLTIQEILNSIEELPRECATSVQVNGIPIPPDIWLTYRPPEGSYIAIRVVPMGGEGKDPLRTLLFIGVMVASFAVGGWVAGLEGSSAFMGSLAAAGTSMLGSLLVNALCPPPQPSLNAGVNREGVVYSITGARNQLNPFGPIPVLLGSHRIVPFYGARPYTEIEGNDQYLRLLFVPSYTPVILSSFKIGETDLEDFEDVEIEIKDVETDDITLYTNVVYEESFSLELLQASGWTQRTTQTDTDEIIIDLVCPTGLCYYDSAGQRGVRTVDFEIQYAVKDSGVWVDTWEYIHVAAQTMGPFSLPEQWTTKAWRVVINLYAGVISSIKGVDGLINPGGFEESPCYPPPVPGWACSLAQIVKTRRFEADPNVSNAMITDERDSCFDRELTGDFLVSAQSPESAYVDVAAGDYRIRPGMTGQTNEVIRKAIRIKVTKGQYDVRIRRITADTEDVKIFDDLYWTTLRSITYESPVTKDDVACIAMRIRATDQLNGIVDTFNCVGISICKDWDVDTSTWIERPTANPASLFRYVLQHPSNKRAVADGKIDLVKLQEWHAFCQPKEATLNLDGPAVDKGGGKVGVPCTDQPFSSNETVYILGTVNYDGRCIIDATSSANEIVITAIYVAEIFTGNERVHTIGLQYNSIVDYQSSVNLILQQIAAAGFASPTFINGKYSVIIDQVQTTPIQHFTPRNSWDFSGSRTYPRIPHALRVIFPNRLRNWEIDEYVVYADGYTEETATLYEQLELPGVTDPDLAYRLGRYHLAVIKLRPEKYSFYADVENLVSTRGDLIHVTHDVPLWGVATGRIKSVVDNGTHATAVVMDSIMTMEAAPHVYSIRFRLSDGSTLLVAVNTVAGEQTTLTFTEPILLASAPSIDDLGLFGETTSESVKLLIFSIEPGSDLTARLTCVDYSPSIYTATTLPIGEHESHITSPYGDVAQSGIPEIYQIRSDESVLYRNADGSLSSRMVITLKRVGGYKDQIAYTEANWKVYNTDESWKTLRVTGYLQEIVISEVEEGVQYTVRLRYILQSGSPTEWCVEELHTIIGKTTAPPIPTAISATAVIGGVKLKWTNPSVVDFQYTGIWRAEADVFPGGSAEYVIPGMPGEIMSFVDRGVAYETTYYYWLKSYDTSGNASSQSASVNAAPKRTETDDVEDANLTAAKIVDALQSENFVSGVSGWYIGFRGVDNGYAEFNDVTVRGELIAGEIHIPDKTAANSFHVSSDGDVWWGCSEADFVSNPENAVAYILKDGTFKFAVGASSILDVISGGDLTFIHGGSIKFTSVTAPAACIAALVEIAGNVDAGTHSYKITYVNEAGETELGTISNVVTADATHKQIDLTTIPISTSESVTSRKIYRTKTGGALYYYLDEIADNVTTIYTDNIADASLGVDATNRRNDSFGKIYVDGLVAIDIKTGIFLGSYAGNSNTVGFENIAIGSWSLFNNTIGYYNIALGYASLHDNIGGFDNVALGGWSLYSTSNAAGNVAIGRSALYNSTGNYNIAIGNHAGYYETGSSAFYVNNQDRVNTAGDKALSLLYGVMAAAAADQTLVINAVTTVSQSLDVTGDITIDGVDIAGMVSNVVDAIEDYEVAQNNLAIIADGTFTITLAAASLKYHTEIVNVGTGVITVTRAGADTIEGSVSIKLTGQYQSVTLVGDGATTYVQF